MTPTDRFWFWRDAAADETLVQVAAWRNRPIASLLPLDASPIVDRLLRALLPFTAQDEGTP